jgi:hypothetical protein
MLRTGLHGKRIRIHSRSQSFTCLYKHCSGELLPRGVLLEFTRLRRIRVDFGTVDQYEALRVIDS